MSDQRCKDYNWQVKSSDDRLTWEGMQVAVLMDIRDELKTLNALLGCHNFTGIPSVLRSIRRNTAKPKKKKP